MNDLGQATAVIEHKAILTIDDVKAQLEQMKRGAIDTTLWLTYPSPWVELIV